VRVEGLLFAFYAVFFTVVTAVYWLLSKDATGTTCLALTTGLTVMIGYYLLFTARRMDARPEDRPEADISEGSGEVGFFPPHSWWPVGLAGGFAVTALGVVFGVFLMLIGFAVIVAGALGMLFEYYVGINRTQGQTLGALEVAGERPTSERKFLGF
jgi:hypothetical protein